MLPLLGSQAAASQAALAGNGNARCGYAFGDETYYLSEQATPATSARWLPPAFTASDALRLEHHELCSIHEHQSATSIAVSEMILRLVVNERFSS